MNNEPDYDNLYFERKPMTQKVFDTDNAEDMALLWSILPEDIIKIFKNDNFQLNEYHTQHTCISTKLLKINWHDKREITRPIQEATKEDFNKLCLFRDGDSGKGVVGVLSAIDSESVFNKYYMAGGTWWTHAKRLTKQEIEEIC